jgi:hypothetical protein
MTVVLDASALLAYLRSEPQLQKAMIFLIKTDLSEALC